ncbi:lipocalin family protein [Flavobacterium sp.]|uniref:lipocalin family protein n=1 Tax=Flavobacterium sp. TaxID=239 RepID=UPI00261C08D9|nr:lipocalin family protein [Flavobacterium sp.]
MKKQILTLGAAALLLASCSSDDNGSSSIDQSLLHKKWYYVSYEVGGQNFPYDDHEACGKDYIELKADGTVRDVDVSECEEVVDQYNYTVDGNTITLSLAGVTRAGKVLKLTGNTLQVEATFDFDGDGTAEVVKENYTSIQ